MKKIDLHTHTNFSDGELSPRELVEMAAKEGISVLGITDHDNVGGIDIAIKHAKMYPIEVVPGIEISCNESKSGFKEVHVIGLFINYKDKDIVNFCKKIMDQRMEQKKQMIGKINEIGYDISFKEISSKVGGSFGRPHIARMLVSKYPDVFPDIRSVFDKLIGINGPAYVKREGNVSVQESIDIIRNEGGLSFLGHPLVYKEKDSIELINKFLVWGGDGIESYYPYHKNCVGIKKADNDRMNMLLQRIAKDKSMLETGGSDFHGNDRARLGEGSLPEELFFNIKKRLKRQD